MTQKTDLPAGETPFEEEAEQVEQQVYDQAADGGDPDDDRGPEDYPQAQEEPEPEVRLVSFDVLPEALREGLRSIIEGATRPVDPEAPDFDKIAGRLQYLTVPQISDILRDLYAVGGGIPVVDEISDPDVEARLQALEGPALTEAMRPRMVINIATINADKAFFA